MERVEVEGGVAVGLDGSEPSMHALRVAAEEAVRRETFLHVVRAWSLRNAPRPEQYPAGAVPSIDEYAEAVRAQLERLVREALGEHPRCPPHLCAVHSPATQGLLSASEGADLLVVGYRGRGGFAGLLLGAVAEQVVRHAHCPVLVVRPQARQRLEERRAADEEGAIGEA